MYEAAQNSGKEERSGWGMQIRGEKGAGSGWGLRTSARGEGARKGKTGGGRGGGGQSKEVAEIANKQQKPEQRHFKI